MRKAAITLAAAAALSLSCYETKEFKVHIAVSPRAPQSCFDAADQVFFDAGFARIYTSAGANLLYTPRLSPTARHGLGWGIAVWVTGGPSEARCQYDVEAMSIDPHGGTGLWFFSAQRGAEYDQAVRDMARRLAATAD